MIHSGETILACAHLEDGGKFELNQIPETQWISPGGIIHKSRWLAMCDGCRNKGTTDLLTLVQASYKWHEGAYAGTVPESNLAN